MGTSSTHTQNLKLLLSSNAPQWVSQVKKELRELEALAKKPASAGGAGVGGMTPAKATGRLRTMQGEGLAGLEHIRQRGGSPGTKKYDAANKAYEKGVTALNKTVEDTRKSLSKTLGAPVRAPSQKELMASFGHAYKAFGSDPRKLQVAERRMLAAVKSSADMATTAAGEATKATAATKKTTAATAKTAAAAKKTADATKRSADETTKATAATKKTAEAAKKTAAAAKKTSDATTRHAAEAAKASAATKKATAAAATAAKRTAAPPPAIPAARPVPRVISPAAAAASRAAAKADAKADAAAAAALDRSRFSAQVKSRLAGNKEYTSSKGTEKALGESIGRQVEAAAVALPGTIPGRATGKLARGISASTQTQIEEGMITASPLLRTSRAKGAISKRRVAAQLEGDIAAQPGAQAGQAAAQVASGVRKATVAGLKEGAIAASPTVRRTLAEGAVAQESGRARLARDTSALPGVEKARAAEGVRRETRRLRVASLQDGMESPELQMERIKAAGRKEVRGARVAEGVANLPGVAPARAAATVRKTIRRAAQEGLQEGIVAANPKMQSVLAAGRAAKEAGTARLAEQTAALPGVAVARAGRNVRKTYRKEVQAGIEEGMVSANPVLRRARADAQGSRERLRAQRERDLVAQPDTIRNRAAAGLANQSTRAQVNRAQLDMLRQSEEYRNAPLWNRLSARAAQTPGGVPVSPGSKHGALSRVGSRMMSTAEYGIGAGILYGGLKIGKDVLDEAGDLQQQLALVESAFEATGEAAAGVSFDGYKEGLRAISKEAGVAVSQAAMVTRQLAGAFSDPESGDANFEKALVEGDTALKFSTLTGLPTQEITDSLTAISLAFDQNFESIADTTTMLSRSFGVTETDIVRFVADIAPLGKELGFTAEQLAGLGAAAQQASGKSGTVLAEQFGRILPALQSRSTDLIRLFSETDSTKAAIPDLQKGFLQGDMSKVLTTLISNYEKLNGQQKQTLANLVGGRREAGAFYAVLDRPEVALRALGTKEGDGAGEFAKRWAAYADTVQQHMKQLKRTIEDFGIALFQAGLGDALSTIIKSMTVLAGVATTLFKVLGAINGALGGFPAKAAGAAVAIKLLTTLMAKSRAGAIATSAMFSGGGMGATLFGPFGRGAAPVPVAAPMSASARAKAKAAANRAAAAGTPIVGASPAPRAPLVPYRSARAAGAGRLNAMAGASAIGGSLAAASPMIAAVLTATAVTMIGGYKNQITEGTDAIGERVAADLESGMSADAVRKKYGEHENAVTKYGSRIFTWTRSAGDQVNREIEEQVALTEKERYTGLAEGLREEEEKNSEAWKGIVRAAYTIDKDTPMISMPADEDHTTAWTAQVPIDSQGFADTEKHILEALDDYEKNPGSPQALQDLKSVLNIAYMSDAEAKKWIDEIMKNLDEDQAERDKLAKEAENIGQARLSYDEAASQYQFGTADLGAVVAAGEKELEVLKDALAAKEKGSDAWFETQRAVYDSEARIAQAITQDRERRRGRAEQRMGFGGNEVSAAQQFMLAASDLQQVTSADSKEGPAARADSAYAWVAARDAAWLEAIENAKTEEEAIALLAQGPPPIDPAAMEAMRDEQFAMDAPEAMAENMGILLGRGLPNEDPLLAGKATEESTEAARIWLAALSRKEGENFAEALFEVIRGRAQRAQAQVDFYAAHGLEIPAELQAELDAANALKVTHAAAMAATAGMAPGMGTPDAGESEVQKRKQAGINADFALQRSTMRDPVARARNEIAELEATLANVDANDPNAVNERKEIQAKINEANAALDDTIRNQAKSLAASRFELQRANAGDNPVALALIDIAEARYAKSKAVGEEENNLADAQIANANRGYKDSLQGIEDAKAQYGVDLLSSTGDTVGAAMAEKRLADAAVTRAAVGSEAHWAALSAQLAADQKVRDSLHNAFAAQQDLAASMYEASGQPLEVARLNLETAQDALNRAIADGVTGTDLAPLQAAVNRAQTSLTDMQQEDRESDLAYLYKMDKITLTQYIAGLKQLLATIPETNKKRRQEILSQINDLRQSLNADLSFNLPSDLKLPTLYEARRMGQNGGGGYQDNKVVTINLTANNAIDGAAAVDTIVTALNGPPRVGVSPRMY